MKKILCFLVVAAVVAQICARPSDKEKKNPADDAKNVAEKAKHEAKNDAGKAKDAAEDVKNKLKKGADDAKDAVENGADDPEDEAKKVVPRRPKEPKGPKHHGGGLFQGIARVGEGFIDSWAGLADNMFGI